VEYWQFDDLTIESHRPQVLHSDGEGRTIAIFLPEGELLQEHQVHERAWLLVLDGRIEVFASDKTIQGESQFLAIFEPKETHEVRALEDSRLLLLLAPWPGVGHPATRNL